MSRASRECSIRILTQMTSILWMLEHGNLLLCVSDLGFRFWSLYLARVIKGNCKWPSTCFHGSCRNERSLLKSSWTAAVTNPNTYDRAWKGTTQPVDFPQVVIWSHRDLHAPLITLPSFSWLKKLKLIVVAHDCKYVECSGGRRGVRLGYSWGQPAYVARYGDLGPCLKKEKRGGWREWVPCVVYTFISADICEFRVSIIQD